MAPACKQLLAFIDRSGVDGLPGDSGLVMRAIAHACLGDKAAAFADIQQAQDATRGDMVSLPIYEVWRARLHVLFGENDAAIAILKRSLAVPFGITTARLRMDPTWTPLRNDLRFQALLKQTP